MSRVPRWSRNITPYALGRHNRTSDLFAVNPFRRSAGAVAACVALIALPFLVLRGATQEAVALLTTWIGLPSLILCLPILILSLLAEGWQRLQRRIWPTVDRLDFPSRIHRLLCRHRSVVISSVEDTPDVALILLSNMDGCALREICRAC